MSRDIANECNQLLTAKDATITTLRQQLAALARECEAWRNYTCGLCGPEHLREKMAATDALIPDLTTIAGGSNGT